MDNYITGTTIRNLREKKHMTQKELADSLGVSDKTVSKWETAKGLPDISLLENLADALDISVPELLSGECISNQNRGGNLLRSVFYVCPICGNIMHSLGECVISCCGVKLPALDTEEEEDEHEIKLEKIETDTYISMHHEMSKKHFISFFANVTGNKVEIYKLYPEQNAEARMMLKGHGILYAYCNKHGLIRRLY